MAHATSAEEMTFGYLSAVESPEHGFFGGYLVVTHLGRPLEFHCTAPVRPNRAQQILYGPTLQPYLLGEQIAGALLRQAKIPPRLVLTDQPATLCIRSQAGVPMVLIRAEDGQCAIEPAKPSLTIGKYSVELPTGYESDTQSAMEGLTILAERVELMEPLERIHEAIREAQRLGTRANDATAHAA